MAQKPSGAHGRELAARVGHPYTATLGDINLALRRDARTMGWEDAWTWYDAQFGDRADYRIWRCLARPDFPSNLSRGWQRQNIAELLRSELTDFRSRSDVSAWSVLIMAAGVLTGKRQLQFRPEDLDLVVEAADQTLHQGLKPVEGYEPACALVRTMVVDAIQKARAERGWLMSVSQADEFVNGLVNQLTIVDKGWYPGRIPYLRMEKLRLFPYPKRQLQLAINNVLFHANLAVALVVKRAGLDGDTSVLLTRTALLAVSAWRLAASLHEEVAGFPGTDAEEYAKCEIEALYQATLAVRRAGGYILCANLAYYLLSIIPDNLASSVKFSRYGGQLGPLVRHAGLLVDQNFERVPPSMGRLGTSPETDPLIIARLKLDQATLPSWKVLLEQGSSDPEFIRRPDRFGISHLRRLGKEHENGPQPNANPEVCSNAYRLCLRYGSLHAASKLLGSFAPTKGDLVTLAHAMHHQAHVAGSRGIDWERQSDWQERLRNALDPDRLAADWSSGELVQLHTVLSGRRLSKSYRLSRQTHRMLTSQFYSQLYAEEIRTENESSWLEFGTGGVGLGEIAAYLDHAECRRLGTPTLVSVASVGAGRRHWNMLVLSRRAEWQCQTRQIPELLAEAGTCGRNLRLLRILEDVCWPAPLRELGEWIAGSVDHNSSRVLLLALDPELCGLPWQNLIGRFAPDLLVAIVPNLSWVLRPQYPKQRYSNSDFSLSSAPDLAELRKVIQAARRARCTPLNIAVVAGHGRIEGGLTSIAAGPGNRPLNPDELVEIGRHRMAVVHSCSGGAAPEAVGDFGGLPGLALERGCRVFCAPVAEVPPAAAIALHRALTNPDPAFPVEFGLRYLEAIRQDPNVSLYNLYGRPEEPIQIC